MASGGGLGDGVAGSVGNTNPTASATQPLVTRFAGRSL